MQIPKNFNRLNLRRVLRGGAFGASVSAMIVAMPAMAQDVDVDTEDRIVVTGSRIQTDATTSSPSPVVAIGGDDIATSGKTDITQLLRETPSLQGSLPANFSAFNVADTEDSDLGVGLLDLRGLGIERTLVLQNGRRHVPGSAGQSAVDTNTIPVSMIDRVEVLTGGASSIYGADAVSGVVNFILRDGSDFDGLEVRGQGGITDNGDAEEAFLSVATGFEFDDGRGSAVIGVEYTRTEPVFASERGFAGSGLRTFAPNSPEVAAFLGIDPDADNTFVPDYRLPISSRFGIIALGDDTNPPSAFFTVASSPDGSYGTVGSGMFPAVQVFDNGALRPYNAGDIFIDGFDAIGGDGIAANPDVELILPKVSRVVLNANTEYEITPGLNFFLEGKFAFSDTFDSVQVNGFNDDIPIALDNPFIPAELQAQIDSLINDDGLSPVIVMSRDTLDDAVRPLPNAERTTFRIVGGFTGNLTDSISYELSYNYGRTEATVTNPHTRIEDRFFAAVDAVRDPMTGEIVCRSDLDPDAIPPVSPFPQPPSGFRTFEPGDGQCAPINLFGENAIVGAGAEFAFVETSSRSVLTQEVLLATLTGDTSELFELPAGPIGWAGGFEYRKEKSDFQPDPLNTAGLTFGSVSAGATQPSGGEYSVYEGFFEARIPILRDIVLFDSLEANGSVRVSDYNTIGTTTTWAVGGRWATSDWLTFRGTYSNAIRSPNIGELFAPQNPSTIGATQDPCNPQFINAGTQFREQNCLMFVAPGFNSTDFNSAFVPGLSGGNPNLDEEKATTITAGMVFRPSGGLEGLTVIADFWDIKIDGAIDALTAFDIAQACVDLPDINNQFCEQIFRDPTDGFITGFVSGQINLGSIETRGVDWSVTYTFDVPTIGGREDMGVLTLGSIGTRFLRYDEFQDPTDLTVFEDRLGSFAQPKWISNFTADWRLGDLGLGWTGRLESSQLLLGIDNSDLESNPNFSDPLRTGRAFVHDITVDYYMSESLRFYGGVNNVMDRDPFVGTLSRPAGPRGRFFFIGVQANL